MQNQNQSGIDSLWLGKNRNTFESLLFALFLFLFSFALATAPLDTFRDGVDTVATTADGIGRGYERTIALLDQNIMALPEIAQGIHREMSTRMDAMLTRNQRTAHDFAQALSQHSAVERLTRVHRSP